MIIRTWRCLHCERRFDSGERAPECPGCGCVRVDWVPGRVNTMGIAPGADAEFRNLAETFGYTDLVSSDRTRGAKPMAPSRSVGGVPQVQFAPGFVAPVSGQAECVPCSPGATAKVSATVGKQLSGPAGMQGRLAASTVVEASHKGQPT